MVYLFATRKMLNCVFHKQPFSEDKYRAIKGENYSTAERTVL